MNRIPYWNRQRAGDLAIDMANPLAKAGFSSPTTYKVVSGDGWARIAQKLTGQPATQALMIELLNANYPWKPHGMAPDSKAYNVPGSQYGTRTPTLWPGDILKVPAYWRNPPAPGGNSNGGGSGTEPREPNGTITLPEVVIYGDPKKDDEPAVKKAGFGVGTFLAFGVLGALALAMGKGKKHG